MVRLRNNIAIIATLTSLLLTSCDATIHFYPEEEDGTVKNGSRIQLNVDWSQYGKEVPTGMTVICHHTETGEKVHTIDNNTSYVTPRLSTGRHWATVFNLTENEYSYIGFRGLDAVETAEAYAIPIQTPQWYSGSDYATKDAYTAGFLEWLAVDTIMTEHVEKYSDGNTRVVGTLYPRNIIYTLHIAIHSENIGNLISARGAISGFADGRVFANDAPNDNSVTVTHLIEADDWTRYRTDSNNDTGMVEADIQCFGLPSNHIGSADENTLEFQAILADGETILKYIIPVGHLISEGDSPPGKRGDNLDLYLDLWLDPSLPPGGNGEWGTDVMVDDWNKEPDVDIPF